MNIVELGAVGEFVGAMAVLITLVFLAMQLRHSSRAVEINSDLLRAETWSHSFQMELEFDRLLIGDSEVADLWLRGGREGNLNETDLLRWQRLARSRVNLARAGHQRVQHGDTQLGRFVDLLARELVLLPEFKRHWEATLGNVPAYVPDRDFIQSVNESIERYESGEGDPRIPGTLQ